MLHLTSSCCSDPVHALLLADTRTKVLLYVQSAGTASRGLESLPSHHFDRSTACTITEAGAQTQIWNTKTTKTTPIIDVQRYLKELNGQDPNNRERGGMSLGSKSLGNKFYILTKRALFTLERW